MQKQMNDTSRLKLINNWLATTLESSNYKIEPASSDASFRRYFRIQHQQQTLILMDAPPEHEELEPFIKIATLLSKNKVNAPHIFAQSAEYGLLLLTDFGNQSLLSMLNSYNADSLYKLALNELIAIQNIQTKNLSVPDYDKALLRNEMNLFPEWFLSKHLNLAAPDCLAAIFELLISNAQNQPQVLVHRDYHSRNLMVVSGDKLGVIDFQDAVIGPISYDLVSLFRDCYIAWPENKIDQWLNEYLAIAKQKNLLNESITETQFKRWFDLMGLQRHLKVLGIFCRLYYRDNKSNYLNDLPLTLRYVIDVASRYQEFSELVSFLNHPKIQAIL